MIEVLKEVEANILTLLQIKELKTMHIDYHEPFVNRIWFQYDTKHRVYLHKIFPSKSSNDALFHPHPWKSAIRIISGQYEMGVGHSETNELPKIDCKLILSKDNIYEMLEENGWHYVNPIDEPSYSLMVTGELNSRKMPVEPNKTFRELTFREQAEIIVEIERYYKK